MAENDDKHNATIKIRIRGALALADIMVDELRIHDGEIIARVRYEQDDES